MLIFFWIKHFPEAKTEIRKNIGGFGENWRREKNSEIVWPLGPWWKESSHCLTKGQLNSEWIDEVIVSPKMPTKNYQVFCPGSLLEGRAEILVIFDWHFGRNDDLINSFWIYLTFSIDKNVLIILGRFAGQKLI